VTSSDEEIRRGRTVRLQVYSDLHVDVVRRQVPPLPRDTDVVVVAGDTCQGVAEGFALLREAIPPNVAVVAVAGNHEFYGSSWLDEIDAGRRHAAGLGITFLENEEAVVAGIRVVGATLWTDYLLMGEFMRASAMETARVGMNDHRKIAWSTNPWLRFRPQEAALLHGRSTVFLRDALARPFDGSTLVVTHHAPHPRSLAARFAQSALNPAYASDLSGLILEAQPTLWVHGHIHSSSDYMIGSTRIVANPAGYGRENAAFDPGLVIEIGGAA
jgi:Icc-related predicted phosphoesterase